MMNNDTYASMFRKQWTEEELDILRRNCADHPVKELLAMLPGRTDTAIEAEIRKLGLPRYRGALPSADWSEWTEAERDIVRRHYADASLEDLLAMLPGRTYGAVSEMARKMGIRKSKEGRSRSRTETRPPAARRRGGITGQARRDCFSFGERGIPAGSRIVLARRPEVVAEVVDDRLVRCGGEVGTPTALGRKILGIGYKIPGARLWTYGGVRLDRLPKTGAPMDDGGE